MAYQTERLGVCDGRVKAALARTDAERARYRRLWAYYRNSMTVGPVEVGESASARPYGQAQEWGLPSRITGHRAGATPGDGPVRVAGSAARKEVVIENDIAWRVDTMVDYLFGREIALESSAADPARKARVTAVLRRVIENHGGAVFFQELALLGSVYGFVDVVVKLDTARVARLKNGTRVKALMRADARRDATAQTHFALGDSAWRGSEDERITTSTAIGEGTTRVARAVPETADAAPPPRAEGGEQGERGGGGERVGRGAGGGAATATATAPPPPSTDVAVEAEPQPEQLVDVLDDDFDVSAIAACIRLEVVEPARAVPILAEQDWRVVEAYGQVWEREEATSGRTGERANGRSGGGGALSRWFTNAWRGTASAITGRDERVRVLEIVSPTRWQRYEGEKLVAEGVNSLGVVPVVHVQNVAVPFAYAGTSDVEPLIPLQDELNTRLSDRANRITMQSFKMYLGKGIEGFLDMPVGPGRMWTTDNEDAAVAEFGGDAACPSEDAHIADVREALDKTSGVTPIAAGAIKNRIGRLTSAAALRITLLALLSKTDKKRTSYGAAVERICELSLMWLDVAGVFATSPDERGVDIHWPSPLPENDMEKLAEGELKVRLGVPKEVVLRELGY